MNIASIKTEEGKQLQFLMTSLLTAVGSALVYSSWPSGRRLQTLDEFHARAKREIFDKTGGIRIDNLAAEELFGLGFMPFDNRRDLMLLPLWISPYVHPDTVITDIYGVTSTFSEAKDVVHVIAGCFPYGILVNHRIEHQPETIES